MRAYYHDDLPGDPRLPHIDANAPPVDTETLARIGVLHWSIPVDAEGVWNQEIERVAKEREYRNRDIVESGRELLGAAYEEKMAAVYKEHMHEDEEIRYVLAGSAFFDLREHPTDRWIRVHVDQGNLLVVPAGIYHRFTLDTNEHAKLMRLFKDEPKWEAHYRSVETDANPRRVDYLKTYNHTASTTPIAIAV